MTNEQLLQLEQKSPFIGRAKELALIEEAILDQRRTRIVFLVGPGGVGKTRILQEVGSRITDYLQIEQVDLKFTEILDFDSADLRTLDGFIHSLIRDLPPSAFVRYRRLVEDRIRMQLADVSVNVVESHRKQEGEILLSEMNSFTDTTRLIVSVDTLEAVQDIKLWQMLLQLLTRVHNVVVIAAGRQFEGMFATQLSSDDSVQFDVLSLEGFDTGEIEEYFGRTHLERDVDPDLRRRIGLFTRGRPILLDLAISWLNDGAMLPELLTSVTEQDLVNLEPSQNQKLLEEFEEALVNRILSLRDQEDIAVLYMAAAHRRCDPLMLADLMGIDASSAHKLIDKLSRYGFIKRRPEGIHVLHDEMRELILRYAWKYIDPLGTELRRVTIRLIEYYDRLLADMKREIGILKTQLSAFESDANYGNALETIRSMAALQRQWAALSTDRLHYAFRVSPERALELFIDDYQFIDDNSTRDQLFTELQKASRHLSIEKLAVAQSTLYNLGTLSSEHFLRQGTPHQAYDELIRLLHSRDWQQNQQEVGILIRLSDAASKIGKKEEAIERLIYALTITESKGYWSQKGIIENTLGRIHRQRGLLQEAEAYYQQALMSAQMSKNRALIASASNNYSYLLSWLGQFQSAESLCQEGLDIRLQLGDMRGVGVSHSTFGEILRYKRDYEGAFRHYDDAKQIFSKLEDKEWLAKIYQEEGIAYLYTNRIYEARVALENSVQLGRDYNLEDLALALDRLGRVYHRVGNYERAAELFAESSVHAHKVDDLWYILVCDVDLVESYYQMWVRNTNEVELIDAIIRLTEPIILQYRELEFGKGFPDLLGRIFMVLGNISFDRTEYDNAREYYQEAIALIGQRPFRFAEVLSDLGKRLEQLPIDALQSWMPEFQRYWGDIGILKQRPELIAFSAQHSARSI